YDKLMSVSVGYINYQPIPRFPGVSRDIALVINRAMPSAKIVNVIKNNGGDILQKAEVFDVYEGENAAEDKKSIELRLSYLDTKQMITDDKVNEVHDRILEAIQEEGAKNR